MHEDTDVVSHNGRFLYRQFPLRLYDGSSCATLSITTPPPPLHGHQTQHPPPLIHLMGVLASNELQLAEMMKDLFIGQSKPPYKCVEGSLDGAVS